MEICIKKSGEIIGKNYEGEEEIVQDISLWLGAILKLEEGIKFQTFFDLLIPHKKFINKVFYSQTGGWQIDHFLKEWEKPEKKRKDGLDIDLLEVYWSFEFMEYTQKKYEDEVYFYPGFHGWGDWNDPQFPDTKGSIGISFTPINELKNIPLVLNTKVSIYKDIKDHKNPHIEGSKKFTLYDVIGAILHEISWNGGPEKRDEELKDLKEITYAARTEIMEGKTISFGKLQLEFLEKDLKEALEEEDYEEAEVIKKEIEEIKSR